MNIKPPVYSYVLSILLGISLLFLSDIKPFPYVMGLLYFFSGLIFGLLWPSFSWRWSFLIAGPILLMMLLSVAFAGISKIFADDVLVLVVPITASFLGSYLGSFFKRTSTYN